MRLDIDAKLSRLKVQATGRECERILGIEGEGPIDVATFLNPHLLTDQHAWQDIDPALRDAVYALYMSPDRTVAYDGIESFWSPAKYYGVWGASIDTLWIAREMKPYLKDCTSWAEVGTGSGFLTQFALCHAPLMHALATDINFLALQCAKANIGSDPRLKLVLPHPDSEDLGLGTDHDLIVCNPPYIPRPDALNDNPYEGLSLIHRLLHQGRKSLSETGQMLINISSVSGDEPLKWLREDEQEPVAEWTVPLKVNVVTNGISDSSRAWLKYLVERDLLTERDPKEYGYRWWHTLKLFSAKR